MVRRVIVLLLALATIAAGSTAPGRRGVPCRSDSGRAHHLTLRVEDQRADGIYAVPARAPRGLVVFAHGYGHTAESWRHHLKRVAAEEGVVAVAMDHRGTEITPPKERGELPKSRGWRVAEGAADSIAAAQLFAHKCRSVETVVMYGISMGANTAGLAAAAGATRTDGRPLFDFLVSIEGASNVTETYQEARLVAQSGNEFASNAQADIEAEMGGTFEQVPDVYLERTVVNRVGDIAASGIRGVIAVHGLEDGTVPYNQSQELVQRLRSVGVPVSFHTVATREEGTEPGTTISSYTPAGQFSPGAGHATETSTTHTVGVTGFELLSRLLDEREVRCEDWLRDGRTGAWERTAIC